MVTDLEYALMKKIQDGHLRSEDNISSSERLTLTSCCKNRWVHIHVSGNLSMTTRGDNAVQEHEYQSEKLRNERAEQEAKEKSDAAQHIIDEKKSRIHDLKMTVLGVVLAYSVEHFPKIVDLVETIIEEAASLFQ